MLFEEMASPTSAGRRHDLTTLRATLERARRWYGPSAPLLTPRATGSSRPPRPGQTTPRPLPEVRGRDHPAEDVVDRAYIPTRHTALVAPARDPRSCDNGRDVRGPISLKSAVYPARFSTRASREPRRGLRRRDGQAVATGRETATARSSSARSNRLPEVALQEPAVPARSRGGLVGAASDAPRRYDLATCGSSPHGVWPPATRRRRAPISLAWGTPRPSRPLPKANPSDRTRVPPIELARPDPEWDRGSSWHADARGTCLGARPSGSASGRPSGRSVTPGSQPLDKVTTLTAIEMRFVLTVGGCLAVGFGSPCSSARDAGLSRRTSVGSDSPTASSCTPSATSHSRRSGSTSTPSPGRLGSGQCVGLPTLLPPKPARAI